MEQLIYSNVSKKYTNFELKTFELTVNCGDIAGLVGANGAGKSTLLNILVDKIKPTSGKVIYKEKYRLENNIDIREMIAFFDGGCNFYSKLTLKDVDRINRGLYRKWNTKQFEDYLDVLKVPQYIEIGKMSVGTRNKMMISAMMSREADILICDELTTGLDPIAREKALCLIDEYVKDNNAAVIFSTHIISDLEGFANRILLIDQGTILADDPIEKYMCNGYGKEFESTLISKLKHNYQE